MFLYFFIGFHVATFTLLMLVFDLNGIFQTFGINILVICGGGTFTTLWLLYSTFYHRFLAHQSFEASNFFWKYVFLTLGSLTLLQTPESFVKHHRSLHSIESSKQLENRPYFEFIRQENSDNPLDQLFFLPWICVVLLFNWFVSFDFVLFCIVIPQLLFWHSFLLLNYINSRFGTRRYKNTRRNNLWTAWISSFCGECWQNNHFAQPNDANFGERWWEPDFAFLLIRILHLLGAASKVKVRDPTDLAKSKITFPNNRIYQGNFTFKVVIPF